MFSQLTVFYYFFLLEANNLYSVPRNGQKILIEIAIGRLGDSGDLKPNKG